MAENRTRFISLISVRGSNVRYRRADSLVPCPCQTPEGFRDPIWHLVHPSEPVCDERGYLPDPAHTTDMMVKAFMQPIQSTRATRLSTEQLIQMFGEIQADDHLGIFPESWLGTALNFTGWSTSGEDFLEYAGQRFTVVNSNAIPDPADGYPIHHFEIGARKIGP
jgi:hypothetical protein